MIVILCNSYQDAQDAYDCFVQFVDMYYPMHIVDTNPAGLTIRIEPFDTWPKFDGYDMYCDRYERYVFVDKRYIQVFYDMDAELITQDLFFRYIDVDNGYEGY